MWPAAAAVILFAGNLAANWVGAGTAMEVFIDQYRPWLWAIIVLSLLLTAIPSPIRVPQTRYAQDECDQDG